MSEGPSIKKWLPFWPWLATIATGVLGVLSFAPFEQTWLCWIALTPLLTAVWFSGEGTKRRWLRDLFLGYVAGVVFFCGVFYWLYTVTVSGLILVGLYMGAYFALWAWLAGLLRPGPQVIQPATPPKAWRVSQPNDLPPEAHSPWLSSVRNLGLALVLAAGWAALEWVRSWMFSGWGWNGLGVPLHGVLPIIQVAEITGVAGLSFVVAFANVIGVATVRRFTIETRIQKRRPHYDFTLTLAGIVGLCGYGIRQLQTPAETLPLRVAAVQANVPREEKFSREYQAKIFAQFERLTHVALAVQPPPQLIIWPESSTPAPALLDEENFRFVMDLSASIRTDLLLGTIDADQEGDYNAAILVANGESEKVQVYRKLHLVPFGEYVPGRHTVPFISRIVGDQVPADFSRGKEPVVFHLTTAGVKVAPLICFEDTLGELTRQFVLRGANLLANVTNDGWFLRTAGSRQHLHNAVFRCVETRRPMARAANTGATCFVNRFGRITQVLLDAKGSQFTEGVLSGTIAVPTNGELTFYVRHGELFAKSCAGLALIFIVLRMLKIRFGKVAMSRRPKPLA